MKKLIVLSVMLLSAVSTFAQWEKRHIEADELKGITESYDAYIFQDENVGSFVFWSGKPLFKIINANGIFNYELTSGYRGMMITVGLYDASDKLIEKFTMWLDGKDGEPKALFTRDTNFMSTPVGQKKKVKKILAHLKTDGYVRILGETYGDAPDFDLKITHLDK